MSKETKLQCEISQKLWKNTVWMLRIQQFDVRKFYFEFKEQEQSGYKIN